MIKIRNFRKIWYFCIFCSRKMFCCGYFVAWFCTVQLNWNDLVVMSDIEILCFCSSFFVSWLKILRIVYRMMKFASVWWLIMQFDICHRIEFGFCFFWPCFSVLDWFLIVFFLFLILQCKYMNKIQIIGGRNSVCDYVIEIHFNSFLNFQSFEN